MGGKHQSLINFFIPFILTLLLPSVFLDTMVWGQCDVLYAVIVVFALLLLYQDHWAWSIFLLGIAISYKLEAIMIVPFFVMAYLLQNQEKHSILTFLWLIVGYYVPYIPAFMHGYALTAPIQFDISESNEYPALSSDAPNFAHFITAGDPTSTNAALAYQMMHQFLIIFTIVILAAMAIYLVHSHYDLKQNFAALAAWVVWTCYLFLPAMHDRYDYLVSVLLVIAVYHNIKYLPFLLTLAGVNTIIYMNSFFIFGANLNVLALFMLAAYFAMTYYLVKSSKSANDISV